MSSKKETYASITKRINALLDRQAQERKRMAAVMSDALLTDRIASRIGDYSDADLKRVMRLLSGHMDTCIVQVENEKKAESRHSGSVRLEHPVNVQNGDSGYHQVPVNVDVQ